MDWGDTEKLECATCKKCICSKKSRSTSRKSCCFISCKGRVKVRDLSKNEGQIAESYYNYNLVEFGDLLLNPMDLYSGANCSISMVEGVISPAYINLRAKVAIVQDSMIITLKHSTGQWQCLHMGKVFLLRIDGP